MQPPKPCNGYDPGSTSASLVARLGSGDATVWNRFIEVYGPLIFGWCLRLGVKPDAAIDVGQHVFQKVYTKIGTFHAVGHRFRAWLYTITHNAAMDHHRRHRIQADGGSDAIQRLHELPAADSSCDAPGEVARLAWRMLDTIRGDFEENTWQAFWRTVIDGEPTADVATALGLEQGTVRQYRHRVLDRLREELGT